MQGTLSSMIASWSAVSNVVASCRTDEACQTQLRSPFPDFYKPTWHEYFDAVARQTRTHWGYQDDVSGFVFEGPAIPLPFSMDVMEGWRVEDHGMHVAYLPPNTPVAIDVSMLGEYSAEGEAQRMKLFDSVRRHWALASGRMFKPPVGLEQMGTRPVDGTDALFFSGEAPVSELIWRQWVLVKDGMRFCIVSAIKPDQDEELGSQVQAMVNTFHVLPRTRPGE